MTDKVQTAVAADILSNARVYLLAQFEQTSDPDEREGLRVAVCILRTL